MSNTSPLDSGHTPVSTYLSSTKAILKSLNTRPRRRLGQNFMIDPNMLTCVVKSLDPLTEPVILEIGPGLGFLTEHLCRTGAQVHAVELDKRFSYYLLDKFKDNSNVHIYQSDILNYDLSNVGLIDQIVVVGNIPYEISSPLLDYLIQHRNVCKRAFLTTQIEFAKRLSAAPGSKECGILTNWVQLFADIRVHRKIPPEAFYPRPKVDSCLFEIVFKEKTVHEAQDEDWIHRLLKITFQKRRKQIATSLKDSKNGFLQGSVSQALRDANVEGSRRPEEIKLHEWVDLARYLREANSKRS